jgi:hypothetical protein
MNSTRGSTPPNSNHDLPNRSTDLNKTLGILGTPHEESIAKFNPTKTCPKRRNRRNPAKSTTNPRTRKTPKSSRFTHGFGRGITTKRTTKGSHKFPSSNPQEKGPETTQRNHQERALKITTKNNREQHIQTLRNHAESSIHETKVHTRSSYAKFPFLITRDTIPSRADLEVFMFSPSDGCPATAPCVASTQAMRSRRVSSASKSPDCIVAHRSDRCSPPVRPVLTGQTGLALLQLRLRFFGLGFVDQPRNPVVFW